MFHFGPRASRENILEEGIKTLLTLPAVGPHWDKWAGRKHVLVGRGEHALKCVSLLPRIPPLDSSTTGGIKRFCLGRDCYWVDYDALVKDGLVLQAWVTSTQARRIEVIPRMLEAHLLSLWPTADFATKTYLIFERVTHGIIAVKDGIIHPHYFQILRGTR